MDSMKRPNRPKIARLVRGVFGALLALGLLTAAQADESSTKERKEFRELLAVTAARSQAQALSCQEIISQGRPQNISYRLALKNEPQYPGAYFVVFTPVPEGRTWSTLIAYEGKRGFVMGNLSVRHQEDKIVYQHSFRGFLTDITRVVLKDRQIQELHYLKFGTGSQPVQELVCIVHP